MERTECRKETQCRCLSRINFRFGFCQNPEAPGQGSCAALTGTGSPTPSLPQPARLSLPVVWITSGPGGRDEAVCRVNPVFLLLLLLWEPAAPRCAISLGYKFIVTPSDQPWYKIQGEVNGSTFLHYICCSKKVKLISVQGMKENATQAWDQQRATLKCDGRAQ